MNVADLLFRHERQGGRAALHAEVGVAAVRQADVRPAEGRRVPLHEEVSVRTRHSLTDEQIGTFANARLTRRQEWRGVSSLEYNECFEDESAGNGKVEAFTVTTNSGPLLSFYGQIG